MSDNVWKAVRTENCKSACQLERSSLCCDRCSWTPTWCTFIRPTSRHNYFAEICTVFNCNL